ncbi:hypothetical protein F2P81_009499 [Scophthalmus maximus]|uniref:Uncharacterized protein n=1 Tax=Scophthalmus maximus TaxID=52904 RepID=A0A6A4T1Q8_SCOMX|nr:hypothetical protein F2P81_009499 [Scophthalmus maximus]
MSITETLRLSVWRLTSRHDLPDRGNHLPVSGELSTEKRIGYEGRNIRQDYLGGRQYLYEVLLHGDSCLNDSVHLFHLIQEEDHGAVHPSSRFNAAMPDPLPHSQTDVLHAAGECGSDSNTVFAVWRLTSRHDLPDRGNHLPVSGELSTEKRIGYEGRNIRQDYLGGRQYLYEVLLHGDSCLNDSVHLFHLIQEEDHGAVHPSSRFNAAMPDPLPHSQTDVFHAAGECGSDSNTVFAARWFVIYNVNGFTTEIVVFESVGLCFKTEH